MIKIKKTKARNSSKHFRNTVIEYQKKKFKANNGFEAKKGKFASHFLEN